MILPRLPRRWQPALTAAAAFSCAVAAALFGTALHGHTSLSGRLITVGGSAGWLVFAGGASLALSSQTRDLLWDRAGSAFAGVMRLALLLAGLALTLLVTLALLRVPVGQLILGGTFLGVVLGIAAQQSLGNLFAGIVLTLTRPFQTGGNVRIRAGGWEFQGKVIEVGLTFVRLDTGDHEPLLLPNTLVLSGAIDLAGPPSAGRRRQAARKRQAPGGKAPG